MSTAPVSVVPGQAPFTPSGEALTRRAVTTVTAAVMVITFAFSLGNVTRLSLDLGITAWIAWLVGPAVDLSVIGLLTGIRFLSLHGCQRRRAGRAAAHAALLRPPDPRTEHGRRDRPPPVRDRPGRRRRPGAADRLERSGPAVAPPDLRRLPCGGSRTVGASESRKQPQRATAVLPARQLARTRELDAEHRAETGRPISRDALRANLRIGRDRAGALVAAVRAEAAARNGPNAVTAVVGLDRSPMLVTP